MEDLIKSKKLGDEISTNYASQVRAWLNQFSADAPVVVVPVYNAYDDVVECIESLLRETPQDIPILVLDDASPDARIPETLSQLSREGGFLYVKKDVNSGFVGNMNLAFELCIPRDVILVNSDVVVPSEWLERLRDAAYCRSNIATATPFTNHGSILSLPERNEPTGELPQGLTLEQVDARVRGASSKARPIIPTAVGHCTYFRRLALDAVGFFDEVFAPGYGEEVDFSQRAVSMGFLHVLADDLFVYHKGSRSFDKKDSDYRRKIQEAHEEIIAERYPWYHTWILEVGSDEHNPLALAIQQARAALVGYRIAIDATCIGEAITGTQVLTLELIRALATYRIDGVHISVIVSDQFKPEVLGGVNELVDEVLTFSELLELPMPCFDLIHRPFQARTSYDLLFLKRVARRFVISQLDFIVYSNPSYAAGYEEWQQYRSLTKLILSSADGVMFISHNAWQDAVHQGLRIPDERVCVAYLGLDHLMEGTRPVLEQPFDNLPRPPFILMLGTNFRHKNRAYALKLYYELIKRYDYKGPLVLAGADVLWGGSETEESEVLDAHPELRDRVLYLGKVSDLEKIWLLEHADLLLYPSIYEGFGMVPFEAATFEKPVLTMPVTSLEEVLGEHVFCLDSWDPGEGAEKAWSLISDAALARQQVQMIRERAEEFRWHQVAERTWDFYLEILHKPSPAFGAQLNRYHSVEWELRNGPVARSLPVWRRQLALTFYILFTQGVGPLLREIWDYIRWILHIGEV
jgi:GT2 family glycosyltransferase/glycosyltransferase involved in cell wall biosynthesis